MVWWDSQTSWNLPVKPRWENYDTVLGLMCWQANLAINTTGTQLRSCVTVKVFLYKFWVGRFCRIFREKKLLRVWNEFMNTAVNFPGFRSANLLIAHFISPLPHPMDVEPCGTPRRLIIRSHQISLKSMHGKEEIKSCRCCPLHRIYRKWLRFPDMPEHQESSRFRISHQAVTDTCSTLEQG